MTAVSDVDRIQANAAQDGVMDLQPEHLRHTRAQIASLVSDIAVASKKERSQDKFFEITIAKLCEAMGAVGAAIWRSENNEWKLVAGQSLPDTLLNNVSSSPSVNLASSKDTATTDQIELRIDEAETLLNASFSDDAEPSENETANSSVTTEECKAIHPSVAHLSLLTILGSDGQPTLIPPTNTTTASGRPPNPTSHCLVYAPILLEAGNITYWLQAVVPPAGGPTTYRGYLRFVVQIADIVSQFVKSHQIREFANQRGTYDTAQSLLRQLDDFRSRSLLSSTTLRDSQEDVVVARSVMDWVGGDEAFFLFQRPNESRIRISSRANEMRIAEHGESAAILRRFIDNLRANGATKPAVLDKESRDASLVLDAFGAQAIAYYPISYSPKLTSKSGFVLLVVLWYRCDESFDKQLLRNRQLTFPPLPDLGYSTPTTILLAKHIIRSFLPRVARLCCVKHWQNPLCESVYSLGSLPSYAVCPCQ